MKLKTELLGFYWVVNWRTKPSIECSKGFEWSEWTREAEMVD